MGNDQRFECFSCGSLFIVSDARAANTPEHFVKTYCSELCYQIDTEEIEKQIKQEQLMQEEAIKLLQEDVKNEPPLISVGGFQLKMRKP